jgi:hypothetical protein
MSPAAKLVTGGTIGANKTASYVVIGGASTVPSNATTVRINVTVKGAKNGTLNFYPAGNVAGGSGQTLSWTGGSSKSGTIEENVGLGNKVTFANSSLGSATVTATITGYSTQVTAGDVNGVGGSAGQVLTNDGSGGASWQTPTQTQQVQGQAFSSTSSGIVNVGTSGPPGTQVDSVTVPAGTYWVVSTLEAFGNNVGYGECQLIAPDGSHSVPSVASLTLGPVGYFGFTTVQMLMNTTTGGKVAVDCFTLGGSVTTGFVENETLVATQVGSGNGVVVNARTAGSAAQPEAPAR